ncbi:MAG: YceI family protein, partial [Xanthomonadales bacterium]|nr:YceI family protein [Xanthomonadales bacterium]
DVVVRREGPLARFGHDHVVSVRGLEGVVLLDEAGAASRADLRFRLEDLAIDTAEGRARYQLDTVPDEKAIEGTRANLMEHVLDAGQWPLVTVRLDDFSFREEHYSAMVTVTINGAQSSSRQPFRLQSSDETVRVEGSLVLRQTDLGLEPFSALGGGLRVADPLEIHIRLTGTRLAGPEATATR